MERHALDASVSTGRTGAPTRKRKRSAGATTSRWRRNDLANLRVGADGHVAYNLLSGMRDDAPLRHPEHMAEQLGVPAACIPCAP